MFNPAQLHQAPGICLTFYGIRRQSAFARYVMNKQLGAVALLNPSNVAGRVDADIAFNDGMWRGYSQWQQVLHFFLQFGRTMAMLLVEHSELSLIQFNVTTNVLLQRWHFRSEGMIILLGLLPAFDCVALQGDFTR